LLAATDQGLVRAAYAREDHDRVLQQLADTVSPRVLRAPARLDLAAREIEEYFVGRRTRFDLPLDFRLSAGFRRTVLAQLPDIAYGTTATYAAIAAAAGNPKAVRAVGSACATNPLPLVVPCHRVVRSDGTIGQYVGGVDAKQTLLTLEAAA
jgi:methylated-DNA-[protein]-cysteine S-methyltransferase